MSSLFTQSGNQPYLSLKLSYYSLCALKYTATKRSLPETNWTGEKYNCYFPSRVMDPVQMPLLQLQFQIMAPPVMQNSPYPRKSFLALPSYSLIAQDNTVMQESKKHHQPILESISKGEKPSLMFFLMNLWFWYQQHKVCLNRYCILQDSGWQKLIYSILLLVR